MLHSAHKTSNTKNENKLITQFLAHLLFIHAQQYYFMYTYLEKPVCFYSYVAANVRMLDFF